MTNGYVLDVNKPNKRLKISIDIKTTVFWSVIL